MFETIFIGTSGLLGHAKGLRVVGNNLANVNTPGFKSSQLQFADLFSQGGGGAPQPRTASAVALGAGLATLGTRINFTAGADQGTGNPLDLYINGNGFYTIRRDGNVLYTRSGDFRFDDKGVLVNSFGDHVLALDSAGKLVDINVADLARSMPKATTTVLFRGNLSATIATPPADLAVGGVTVLDGAGAAHQLALSFQNDGGGDYTVTVSDAAGAAVATGPLKFANGFPRPPADALSFSYAPAGAAAFTVKLDFSTSVTSLAEPSTLAVAAQDGYAAGLRTGQEIDAAGIVQLHYSNGQTGKGARLALANFAAVADLEPAGGSAFASRAGSRIDYGYAGSDAFGTLAAGRREGSNVDLAEEFGNLILMQRGYQASSHVISTANDMIQQLFDMKGHR